MDGSKLRKKMCDKFSALGGILKSIKSRFSEVGSYDVEIGDGCNILSGGILSNSITVGKANIIYYNVIITKEEVTGDFVEISLGAQLFGRCSIGDFTAIGSNAVILQDIKIGQNVVVGAGAVDFPDNSIAVSISAKIIKIDYDSLSKN